VAGTGSNSTLFCCNRNDAFLSSVEDSDIGVWLNMIWGLRWTLRRILLRLFVVYNNPPMIDVRNTPRTIPMLPYPRAFTSVETRDPPTTTAGLLLGDPLGVCDQDCEAEEVSE
jgi:hypothetical protein